MIRRQPPVYSPIHAGVLAKAVTRAWTPGRTDPRSALSTLLADRYGAAAVALLGSGTQALTLAIRLARQEQEGPVALPGFTCYDVATAAIGADAPVLLYDLDPQTLGPDWSSLEAALEGGARTIVVAYLYGFPVDWDRVQELAEQYGATVIEDSAQGTGASWRGRPLGALGELSVLSFGRGKGWTGGGGGALLARGLTADGRSDLSALTREQGTGEIRTAVTLLAQWALGRPSLYGLPYRVPWLHLGETHYREPEPLQGIPRISAGAVTATAEQAAEAASARRRVASLLRRATEKNDGLQVPVAAGSGQPGYLRLPIRVVDSADRVRLLSRLEGTGAAPSYPTSLDDLPQIRDAIAAAASIPNAEALAAELVTVPTHSLLQPRDLERLTTTLSDRR